MANTLSKTGITDGSTIQPAHVTQSIDAFTGTEAYDITLSGSLTFDLNGGYNMTASAGNYVEEMDTITGSTLDGLFFGNQKGISITHQGTYAPTTASSFLAETLLMGGMTASGHRKVSTNGNYVNSSFVGYYDQSGFAGQPAGTVVNNISEMDSTNKGNANINYSIIAGYQYSSNAQGINLSGTNASGEGALFLTNESSSGYSVLANTANISGSTLFDIRNDVASGSFIDIRNDGMVILQMVSMSFSASNDSDAATKGVPTGGLYHTSGAIKIRLS
tara:strand:+ start:678 stop:1505 length:828 start_codon:yes stop_codon:yes gene_type:complete